MAELLKNRFNEEFVRNLGQEVLGVFPSFRSEEFISSVLDHEWEGRELKDRMRHISNCLGEYLPTYSEAVDILGKVVHHFDDLPGMVFPDFVEVFGLDNPEQSLDALELFTKYSSSEFAIRPFIVSYEDMTMSRMLDWSKYENHHVRRLSSEGCRSRLPWAMALPAFKKDPSKILPILENLKADESEYVRKSVANNINDITKDNPDLAIELAKRWYGHSEHTNWILKHGLRTLLKKGNEEALKIFGFQEKVEAKVDKLKLSDEKVKMGGLLNFGFEVSNSGKAEALLKIGYKLYYVKSNGQHSPKIFHVAEKSLAAGSTIKFDKKLSFKDLTTRKHFPGEHKIAITINGEEYAMKNFELV